MDKRIDKRIAIVAVIMFLIITAIFVVSDCYSRDWYLTLRSGDTGEIYAQYSVKEGDTFSIGFVHSVNKTPVTDVYEVRDHQIYVIRTIYYDFGAGVQTILEDGQSLRYGEDGEMIVEGFDREMPDLSYIVGTVSDHTLTFDGREISLRNLCGKNAAVSFSIEHKHIY